MDEPTQEQLQRGRRQKLQSLQRSGLRSIPAIRNQPAAAAAEVTPDEESVPVAAVPVVSTQVGAGGSQAERLRVIEQEVAACQLCPELVKNRSQTVFGVGNPDARLCFMGEAPGADEDIQGIPFVGRAGKLLTQIIEASGLRRDDVYILNTLKCRPPGNRNPLPEEASHCSGFLARQLEVINPEFICCLGAVAAQNLLGTSESIGRLRGRFHPLDGYQVLCTYHPAYLLRNPSAKRQVWEDMKILLKEMGLPIPEKL
jgi:DNA polymerase